MSDSSQKMASRTRKQRFPHPDRRRNSSFIQSSPFSETEYESDDNYFTPNKRLRDSSSRPPVRSIKHVDKTEPKDGLQSSRLDKRARDEHNEQERSRRRELAVIYELIRCSFSQEDLRHLGPGNAPKSIDKLSYPQVLQIAYHVVREENHNLQLFERTLAEIKRIEKEFLRIGLPVPTRPTYPSVTDTYRKVVNIVDGLLKHDKAARAGDGSYETTPAQRAALGDYQLAFLRPKNFHESLYGTPSCNQYTHSPIVHSSSRSSRNGYQPVSQRQSMPPVHTNSASINSNPPPSTQQTISPVTSTSAATTTILTLTANYHNLVPPVRSTNTLPRICTVFKNDMYDLPESSSPCIANIGHEDDVISSRTMQHSSSAASMEYIDEVDLPPISESLLVEDDMYFCENSMPTYVGGAFSPDDAPIFPEIPI